MEFEIANSMSFIKNKSNIMIIYLFKLQCTSKNIYVGSSIYELWILNGLHSTEHMWELYNYKKLGVSQKIIIY